MNEQEIFERKQDSAIRVTELRMVLYEALNEYIDTHPKQLTMAEQASVLLEMAECTIRRTVKLENEYDGCQHNKVD